MRKEELIKGRKYEWDGEAFTFEKFDDDGDPYFLDEGQDYAINEDGFIGFGLNHVSKNFIPVETDEVWFEVSCVSNSGHKCFTTIETAEPINSTYKLIRPKTPQSLSEWLEANGMSEQEAIDKLKKK